MTVLWPGVSRTGTLFFALTACLASLSATASVIKSRPSTISVHSSFPRAPDLAFSRRQESTKTRLQSLVLPFPRSDVTSKFGLRFNPILKAHIFHRGVDFGAPLGTPVRAAQAGVIELSRESPGAGLYVRISHGDNVETCYEHLSGLAPNMHRGSHVSAGEVIGLVGKSGWATGPNLHYEVIVNGNQIDPLKQSPAVGPIRVAQLR